MSIARVGASLLGRYAAQTGSINITVPAGTDLAVIGFTGYGGVADGFADGTLTLDGDAMVAPVPGDGSTSAYMGCLFYLVAPSIGAGLPLAWSWTGTDWTTYGGCILGAFYSGVDQTTPLRHSYGAQFANTGDMTSGTLTAQAGDVIVAFAWSYTPDNANFAWTGATEIVAADTLGSYRGDDSLAETSPTGNQTVHASYGEANDGGLSALVLTPAGGGGPAFLPKILVAS